MKILFIAPRIPSRGTVGGSVLVYERIRRLAKRGHQIGLAAFDQGQDPRAASDVKSYLSELETLPAPPRHKIPMRVLRFMTSPIPTYYHDFRSMLMMRTIGDMVERSRYDVAVAEFSVMGQYLHGNPYLSAVRKIISCHYSVAASYRKTVGVLKFTPQGLRSRISLGRLSAYEIALFRAMDRVLVLNAQERFGLLNQSPDLRIQVVPSGVDTNHFRPSSSEQKEDSLLFTGDYEQIANRDAVFWFATNVWPRLKKRHPGLKFYVVGPGVTTEMKKLAAFDLSIVVTGYVPDVRPYFQKAKIFVSPIRLGAGLRVKMLEPMAAGVPVVTTSLGAEGIPIQTGDNAFVADKPQMMADYIELLLNDEPLRHSMSRQARSLIKERFSWPHTIDLLEQVLYETVGHVKVTPPSPRPVDTMT